MSTEEYGNKSLHEISIELYTALKSYFGIKIEAIPVVACSADLVSTEGQLVLANKSAASVQSRSPERFGVEDKIMENQRSPQELPTQIVSNTGSFLWRNLKPLRAKNRKEFFESVKRLSLSYLRSINHVIIEDRYYPPALITFFFLHAKNVHSVTFSQRKNKYNPRLVKLFFNTSNRKALTYYVPKDSKAVFDACRGKNHLRITIKTLP